jgi:hypothetical protein
LERTLDGLLQQLEFFFTLRILALANCTSNIGRNGHICHVHVTALDGISQFFAKQVEELGHVPQGFQAATNHLVHLFSSCSRQCRLVRDIISKTFSFSTVGIKQALTA